MFSLNVDYRPEGELACAIKKSKLKASFPIKTCINISRDKIEVQKGLSSPFEVIYSKVMNKKYSK